MADLDALRSWMDGYLRAWARNDPADIVALFTEDARYRTAPFRDPLRGHDEIVAMWIEREDEPGWSFDWAPVRVLPDLAIVEGTTRYDFATYSNLWLLHLEEDGRCSEFTEWWMNQASTS